MLCYLPIYTIGRQDGSNDHLTKVKQYMDTREILFYKFVFDVLNVLFFELFSICIIQDNWVLIFQNI